MLTGQTGLGFNPLSTIKHAAQATGHGIATGARATGHVAAKGAKLTVRAALLPYEFGLKLTEAATRLALRPVTSRVRTLTNRRANKIAWDNRKSKTPTPAENAQAKSWTKSQLKKKLPHGPLLAMLAGPLPMPTGLGSMGTNLGIAPAVIAALIPVFIAILNAMLQQFSRSGEAPVAIGPDGQPIMNVDPTMVPDAAADDGPPPGSGGPDTGETPPGAEDAVMAPGGPVKKGNVVLIGGVIVGVVVLAMLMGKKKK
jgi:hypothetical protein